MQVNPEESPPDICHVVESPDDQLRELKDTPNYY